MPQKRTIPRTCESCGEPFFAQPCDVAKGWGRFCSRACANDAQHGELRYIVMDCGYETPCWVWQGHIQKGTGYGTLGIHLAHRLSWERVNGSVPEGLDLDHLCRVRCCINPAHLEPVTRRENVMRGVVPKLSDEDVQEIRLLLGKERQDSIAARYGVTPGHISRLMASLRRKDGWARYHDVCVECGRTDRPHTSHGLCTVCAQRKWRRDHISGER